MSVRLLPLVATLLLATACSRNEPPAPAQPARNAVGATTATAPPADAAPNSGKVFQVLQAGPYTYAEVEARPGVKAWMAGTQIDVQPGDTVQWAGVALMRNFNAQSLGRSFDEILFVSQWGKAGAAIVATPAHGSLTTAQAAAAPVASGVVKSVATGGGYSYIEVDQGGTTVWVAAVETPMKPGDRISWSGGSEMSNFAAKSIGRNFDRIIFASAVNVSR